MAKFHLSKDGTPRSCGAQPGKCPLDSGKSGDEVTPHFADEKSARKYYEESMKDAPMATVKRKSTGYVNLIDRMGITREKFDELGANKKAKNTALSMLTIMGDGVRKPEVVKSHGKGGIRLEWGKKDLKWKEDDDRQYIDIDPDGLTRLFEVTNRISDSGQKVSSRIPLMPAELITVIKEKTPYNKGDSVVPLNKVFDSAEARIRPERVEDFRKLKNLLEYQLENGSNARVRGAAARAIVLADGMWESDWNDAERREGETQRMKFQYGIENLVQQKTGKSVDYEDSEQGSREALAEQLLINTSFHPRGLYQIAYDNFNRDPSEDNYDSLMNAVNEYEERNDVKEPLTKMLISFQDRNYIAAKPGPWLLVKEVETADRAWKNQFPSVQFGG